MHISDGILTETIAGTVLLAGTSVLAACGVIRGLKSLDHEKIPKVAVLSSAFFAASLVHLKIGLTSVHLILNGLVGIILGWAAFPAFLIALLLQTLFFGHGGLTTLGLNTFNFGVGAIVCYAIFIRLIKRDGKRAFLYGFLAGSLSLLLAAGMIVVELLLIGEEFSQLAGVFFISHIPVAVIEGLVSAFAVSFLYRVKPDVLNSFNKTGE